MTVVGVAGQLVRRLATVLVIALGTSLVLGSGLDPTFRSPALAGPNQGGLLILHTDDSVVYTADDTASYRKLFSTSCRRTDPWSTGPSEDCVDLLSELNGTSGRGAETTLFWVVGAFRDWWPSVLGVQFGLDWGHSAEPTFLDWGSCGDFEVPTTGWPSARGSGTAVTWTEPVHDWGFPIYWFAVYVEDGPLSMWVDDFPEGGDGAAFADDSIPSVIDPVPMANRGILGLNGAIGFGDLYDSLPVDSDSPTGACCLQGDQCHVTLGERCEDMGGRFLGEGVSCDPDPCALSPTVEQSWGEVKAQFRK